MGDRSAIEWTDATWNPLVGCSRVSEGCRRCYAERLVHRGLAPQHRGLTKLVGGEPRWTGEVRLVEGALDLPLRWKRPRRIFVNSLSDLFHEAVPDEWIDQIVGVMAVATQHVFQVLTKRPRRMLDWWLARKPSVWRDPTADEPDLSNVWWGVSVENQETADARIPLLLQTPAAVRFVSCEPLLSAIDLSKWLAGGGHDDRRRAELPSSSGAGVVHSQAGRHDLAAHQVSRRRDITTDEGTSTSSGAERSSARKLSEGDVRRRRTASKGSGQPNRMDDCELARHSPRHGSEPYRRDEAEQRSLESRIGDARGERDSFGACAREQAEVQSGGIERSGEVDCGPGSRNPVTGGEAVTAAARDRTALWGNSEHGVGDSARQSLVVPPPRLDWLIVGGESGPGARPFDLAWARTIVAQCRAAGVPVFVKQLSRAPYDSEAHWISRGGPVVIPVLGGWTIREPLRDRKGGDWTEWPEDLRVREFPA